MRYLLNAFGSACDPHTVGCFPVAVADGDIGLPGLGNVAAIRFDVSRYANGTTPVIAVMMTIVTTPPIVPDCEKTEITPKTMFNPKKPLANTSPIRFRLNIKRPAKKLISARTTPLMAPRGSSEEAPARALRMVIGVTTTQR